MFVLAFPHRLDSSATLIACSRYEHIYKMPLKLNLRVQGVTIGVFWNALNMKKKSFFYKDLLVSG